jgi:hypothetical protein
LQQCSNALEDLLKRDADAASIRSATIKLLDAIRELRTWSDAHDFDVLFEETPAAANEIHRYS